MFGRRYLDRNEDGNRSDGVLRPGASAADHAALLQHVRPLLRDADLTVVNLETALRSQPFLNPVAARPSAFHPTKEFVFASAPESAQALVDVGVDLVSLGNDHVMDALGPGLDSTLAALDRVGLPHFGAGRTVDEAWTPAVVQRKGQLVAYLGCTTITGTDQAITYVARAGQPGAARCTTARLAREVRVARAQADLVVVMIHGGKEYEAHQTALVRRLTHIAAVAGAAVVVNGHPHVVGAVHLDGSTVVADTMGNLLFDQTVWPTFLSYLLRVDVRSGTAVSATVDPLLLEGEIPRPVVGLLADTASRRAAGLVPGPLVLQGPGAAFSTTRRAAGTTTRVAMNAGQVSRLAPGRWVGRPHDGVAVGEDLLWTGSFEDMDTDPGTSGAHQWSYGKNVEKTGAAACSGAVGMQLQRSPVSTEDVVLTPTHRQLVRAGTSLSLVADVLDASPGAALELALFEGTKGPSTSTLRTPIPMRRAGDNACTRVRLDTVVPPGTVAVQPILRLAAPSDNQRAAHLRIDDVQLVQWSQPGAAGRRFDVLAARVDTTVDIVDDHGGTGGQPFVGSNRGD